MPIKKDIIWRVGLVYAVVMLFALMIVGRVVTLQLFEGDYWRGKAQKISQRDVTVHANRGDICAEDGRLLATSLPYYQLRMDFKASGLTDEVFKLKVDSLALCLSQFFNDKSKNEYRRFLWNSKYKKKSNRYVLINRRKVNYNELKVIRNFPLFRLGQNKGGLICEQENIRRQPHRNLATRTIGYLNKEENDELIGRVGMEGAFESELKGVDGVSIMQKMSGRWLPVNMVEPKDGNDLITTIDVNYQDVAESALYHQLVKYNAHHGSAILMEVKTGAIKAIANIGYDEKENVYSEMYNYAIGEATEPGSTFKLASMMALLEDGYVGPMDSVDTGNGIYSFYNAKMRDSHYGGYGKITVQEAFEKSSNVGISRLVDEHYKNKPREFINRLYDFRLNEPLGLEIRGEGAPKIKYPDDPTWSGISLPWMSIGYSIHQTPLQTLTFYNAIANDGKMMKPKFVKEIRYHGEVISKFDDEVLKSKICSGQTLETVQNMLEGVVLRGTARNLRNSSYKIAGKTGTAQIADGKKGYGHKVYQASFVGYFPADDPMYSCIVVINRPNKTKGFYGNQVAGPVFKSIADKVYAMSYSMHPERENEDDEEPKVPVSLNGSKEDLDLVFNDLNIDITNQEIQTEWVVTSRKDSVIEYKYRRVKSFLVPNVKGMGVQDALYILENAGLRVHVRGVGSVSKQSLRPGSNFHSGDEITIDLS
ncbi:penicillin-binding protein [Marinifilum fragile]|uniref:penicillin-binding protein n=1 Tax=Marinifilum fragile TaxID=570161 RepID=UPI002AA8ED28|nr:penicillin-binding protein [Marinifilum fragile]